MIYQGHVVKLAVVYSTLLNGVHEVWPNGVLKENHLRALMLLSL